MFGKLRLLLMFSLVVIFLYLDESYTYISIFHNDENVSYIIRMNVSII